MAKMNGPNWKNFAGLRKELTMAICTAASKEEAASKCEKIKLKYSIRKAPSKKRRPRL